MLTYNVHIQALEIISTTYSKLKDY